MSAAAAAPDRLSNLSDDLLTHILSFAPTREAARTTALSRRWRRPLWLNTAAVNIDYRSYTTTTADGANFRWRAMDDADHAFALQQRSLGCCPKKLTVLMRHDATTHLYSNRLYPCRTEDNEETEDGEEEEEGAVGFQEEEDNSGSGVEELRVEWLDYGCPCITFTQALSLRSLPFVTLRVLDLTGCYLPGHSEGRRAPFPCLEAMRLRRCRAALTALQDMFSAAPRLAEVRLEAVQFLDDHRLYRLRCPAATAVVMANSFRGCTVKLDAPRLRRFHYEQVVNVGYVSHGTFFFLKSPTSLPLDHVHLAMLFGAAPEEHLRHSLLFSVCHTRVLRLTVFSLADLYYGYMPMSMSFTRLERLELKELAGWCIPNHAVAANGFVGLLSSCRCLRELRLKFSWREYIRETNPDPADEMAAIADFSPCRSIDRNEAGCCHDLEDDLHGRLSGRCTLDCLKRVVVEFDADELTCFQVLLLKFLTKNAANLEEVVVDGGKGYDSSRINLKVMQWRWKWKPRPLSPPPPPPLSEFPPLEAPPCLDGEVDGVDHSEALAVPPCLDREVDGVHDTEALEVPRCSYRVVYDDDDTEEEEEEEEEEAISPRHFMHRARKTKKGGSPECWSVKPKHKGLITDGWSGGGADGPCRQHRRGLVVGGGGGVTTAGSLPLPAATAVQRFPCSVLRSWFRSLRDAPPQATPWRSLFERRGTTPPVRPRRLPLITELFCG